MPDLIQVLLVIWFVGSLIVLLIIFFSTPTYVFRTAIIGYMSNAGLSEIPCTINAIDDLGNNLTINMKAKQARELKVGDKITVTVPR